MDSADSIDRLLKIEQQASQIIQEAEEKASRLLIEAKAQSQIVLNQKISQMQILQPMSILLPNEAIMRSKNIAQALIPFL